MDLANRVKLAQYHHKQGMRRLALSRDNPELSTILRVLAANSFEARTYNMSVAKALGDKKW